MTREVSRLTERNGKIRYGGVERATWKAGFAPHWPGIDCSRPQANRRRVESFLPLPATKKAVSKIAVLVLEPKISSTALTTTRFLDSTLQYM